LPSPQAVAPYYVGLEQALIDNFKREAAAAVAYLRVKGGRSIAVPYFGDVWTSPDNAPLLQWWDMVRGESPEVEKNFWRWEFAAIVTFDHAYPVDPQHSHL
jgi:hypothetical protein